MTTYVYYLLFRTLYRCRFLKIMINTLIFVSTIAFALGTEVRPLCPPNEHYSNCMNDCRTCADPKPLSACNNTICDKGCECDDGFIRTKKANGMCIPFEKCKNCLDPNFEFKECGSSCKTTCKDGNIERNVCPRVCEPGCYCKGNKVLDEATNECISVEECKKRKRK
ncbi:alpha-tectorin-like [Harmonia axyridis]|uniref:alpha-tectorin-like n=1 Tax=Harmonia axyridis TaxID=115357 RepID=UPI001E2775BA|nr:alpha-tectorin-like [Harmonia axyridis]